jgi:hypothetical protein
MNHKNKLQKSLNQNEHVLWESQKKMINISPKEMDKLAILWENHRYDCKHQGDMKIELLLGGGIGTVVKATCGCKHEMDITDYYSW